MIEREREENSTELARIQTLNIFRNKHAIYHWAATAVHFTRFNNGVKRVDLVRYRGLVDTDDTDFAAAAVFQVVGQGERGDGRNRFFAT